MNVTVPEMQISTDNWIVGLAVAAILAGSVGSFTFRRWKDYSTSHWPKTKITVEAAWTIKITKGRKVYHRAYLAYWYEVAGSRFGGNYHEDFRDYGDAKAAIQCWREWNLPVRHHPEQPVNHWLCPRLDLNLS